MARLTDEVFGGIYGNGSGNSPVRDIFWFHLWFQCQAEDYYDASNPADPQCRNRKTDQVDNLFGVMKLIHTWSDEEDTDYPDDEYTFYDFNDVGLCDAVRDAYPNEPPSNHQYCFGDAEYGVNDPNNP